MGIPGQEGPVHQGISYLWVILNVVAMPNLEPQIRHIRVPDRILGSPRVKRRR